MSICGSAAAATRSHQMRLFFAVKGHQINRGNPRRLQRRTRLGRLYLKHVARSHSLLEETSMPGTSAGPLVRTSCLAQVEHGQRCQPSRANMFLVQHRQKYSLATRALTRLPHTALLRWPLLPSGSFHVSFAADARWCFDISNYHLDARRGLRQGQVATKA